MLMDVPEGYIIIKKEDYELLLTTIKELRLEVIRLQQRVDELESRLSKNSSNSHKPPSSDGYKKVIKNNREKTGKQQGAQPGNKGNTLELTDKPDNVLVHKISGDCPCGQSLKDLPVKTMHRRQVFDLPEKMLNVTEQRIEIKPCLCGIRHEAACPGQPLILYKPPEV